MLVGRKLRDVEQSIRGILRGFGLAANVVLSRPVRFSALKRCAMDIAKRRGLKRAKVALARKLGIVLHRMWAKAAQVTA